VSAARGLLGAWGERQARLYLETKGYEIVAANFRCRAGELDIIARQGPELVIVEVKTRRGMAYGGAEESVPPARASRLAEVAEEFLQSCYAGRYGADTEWRIDLICVNLDPGGRLLSLRHIEHAVEF